MDQANTNEYLKENINKMVAEASGVLREVIGDDKNVIVVPVVVVVSNCVINK